MRFARGRLYSLSRNGTDMSQNLIDVLWWVGTGLMTVAALISVGGVVVAIL